MCGFFVTLNKKKKYKFAKEHIIQAGTLLNHRGRDDNGYYGDDTVMMYFARLSIIDIQLAHQPMLSSNERYVLVFNGEIYNYLALKEELIKQKEHFETNSDTEVILKLYQRDGEKFITQLRGMFSIVIWDKVKNKLFIARDRLGIKPLYIFEDKNNIILSSEIKSILCLKPELKKENKSVIFKYLARGWVDDTNDTFYHDIKSFPASQYALYNLHERNKFLSYIKYWDVKEYFDNKVFDKSVLEKVLVNSIKEHLHADVNIASTLSGGIDSNAIVTIIKQNSNKELTTFSISPENTFSENYWIEKSVDTLDLKHHYTDVVLNQKNKHIIDDILYYHDEPFLSTNCIYQYLLRERISKKGFKVLLVGEGGDEVFGGYSRMLLYYLNELLDKNKKSHFMTSLLNSSKLLNTDIKSVLKRLKKFIRDYDKGLSGQENTYIYEILNPLYIKKYQSIVDLPAYESKKKDKFKNLLLSHIFKRDLPYVLKMEDRNSMAFGIESRVPMLDHKLIEKVFSFSFVEFMKNAINKNMLREVIKDKVHPEIINRKDKSPRPGSDAHIVYEILKDDILEAICNDSIKVYLVHNVVQKFTQDLKEKNKQHAIVWFRIYLLFAWKNLLLNKTNAR